MSDATPPQNDVVQETLDALAGYWDTFLVAVEPLWPWLQTAFDDFLTWLGPLWGNLTDWLEIAVIVAAVSVQGALSGFQVDDPPPPVPFLVAQSEGIITFRSQSPYDFVDAAAPDEDLEDLVLGQLAFPESSNDSDQFPAMILTHGSDGVHGGTQAHAQRLRDMGIATFIVDSFSTRGVRSVAEDQIRVTEQTMIADVYAALDLLAGHPRVDAARIGVIGFSKGGTVAVYSASAKVRQWVARGAPQFAVHIGLYPFCNVSLADPATTGAPVYMLLGEADDYTPARHCMTLQSEWNAVSGKVTSSIYPGAAHSFDSPAPIRYIPDVVKVVRDECRLLIDDEGVTKSPFTGGTVSSLWQRVDYLRQCGDLGASLGGTPSSERAVQREIALIVQETLLAPPSPASMADELVPDIPSETARQQ